MRVVLLIAGIGFLLAGLLTIGFGIQLDLSLGNTLILTGAVVVCTGMIMLGLWTVVQELRNIAGRLGPDVLAISRAAIALQPAAVGATPRSQPAGNDGFLLSRDRPTPDNPGDAEPGAPSPAPWQDETTPRNRVGEDALSVSEPVAAAPTVKPRRNLLFSSSSRRERERAKSRVTEPSAVDVGPAPVAAPLAPESSEVSPTTFDDAWPKPERSGITDAPPQRRSDRAPSSFTEANTGTNGADRSPPTAQEEQPPVTVLKSGVVDGMAYSLYSDGSIEAQMPEGMMRFASIDELRSHLDQRP